MNPPMTSAESPARNPVALSLALAVLAVALAAAAIMGAVVFGVLLVIFAVGYLVSLAHAWWRRFRRRRRSVAVAQPEPPAVKADYIEGAYQVVEAAVDAAPRGPGGTA